MYLPPSVLQLLLLLFPESLDHGALAALSSSSIEMEAHQLIISQKKYTLSPHKEHQPQQTTTLATCL